MEPKILVTAKRAAQRRDRFPDFTIDKERPMAVEGKKDREAWSPRIDSNPLFKNSADYERELGEENDTDIDIEEDEGTEDEDASNSIIKPAR
jgi:hypothetical protein